MHAHAIPQGFEPIPDTRRASSHLDPTQLWLSYSAKPAARNAIKLSYAARKRLGSYVKLWLNRETGQLLIEPVPKDCPTCRKIHADLGSISHAGLYQELIIMGVPADNPIPLTVHADGMLLAELPQEEGE